MLFLAAGTSMAQTTATGTVYFRDDGTPVIGASVFVVGTSNGTVTNESGKFSLAVPDADSHLIVSFMGMRPQEVAAGRDLRIELSSDVNTLNDVVVTALGVSREKKALGYSVAEVSSDEMTRARGGLNNPVNALQGKVAGLQISSGAGSMGGSSKILIRGSNSLSGSNQPLFVVDGVPIEGTDYNGTGTARGGGGYDYGNLVQDINPDDIESVSVLKGASASALYGSRASNGVIMITTKKAKGSEGYGVTFNSSVNFEQVTKLPKLQTQYGGGYGYAGEYAYGEDEGDDFSTETIAGKEYLIPDYGMDESWGPKLDGRRVLSWYDLQKWVNGGSKGAPTTSAWSPATSDFRDFFRTGVSFTNNVAISQSYGNSAFRISYTNTDLKGYVPNSSQVKNAFNVSGNLMSKDRKLNVFTVVNFFNQRATGRAETGYGDNNVMVKFTQWGQRQLNMEELKDLYMNPDGTQASWNIGGVDDLTIQFHNNPYWSRYMNYENDSRNRIYGNAGVSWRILPQLTAQYKANLDFFVDKQYERNAVYSQELSRYSEISRQQYEINHEFLLMYKDTWGDFSLNANLGANIMKRHYEYVLGETQGGLGVPMYYNLANSVSTAAAYNYKQEKGINSVFGDATLGWKSMLFLQATLRGDKSSTLPEGRNTYVYPSVTASWLFSELLQDSMPWLEYGKLRAGFAKVGSDTDPYMLYRTYSHYTRIDPTTPGYRLPNTLTNLDLRPESTTSWEFGLEGSAFNDRIGFDLTWYSTVTKNEILPLSVSGTTGYIFKTVNSGEISNKGVEFAIHGSPVRTRDFEWSTSLTLASNKNRVNSLTEGVDYYRIVTAPFMAEIGAVVGEEYGIIRTTDYLRDEAGHKLVDPESGLYIGTDGYESVGSIFPDFTGGWVNTFRWKNFDASVQLDFSRGGHFFSTTYLWGMYCGMFEETAADGIRENGIVVDGYAAALDADGNLVKNADGSYKSEGVNTVKVSARDYGENHYTGPGAQNVFRSDYVKLREVTLGYTFKLKPNAFVKSLRLSAYGRNLAVWGPDTKHFDPEMLVTSSGNIQGIEGGATPMVANTGFTVSVKF